MCKGISKAILEMVVAYGRQVYFDGSMCNGPVGVNTEIT